MPAVTERTTNQIKLSSKRQSCDTYIPIADTSSSIFLLCEHRTCDADDGPLCRVQHISRGWLGALDAMVFGQVPGQRVSRGRRVTYWTQITGALLRRSPDQRPPLGLVLHLLHSLDGHSEQKRTNMDLENLSKQQHRTQSLCDLCNVFCIVIVKWTHNHQILVISTRAPTALKYSGFVESVYRNKIVWPSCRGGSSTQILYLL